MKNVGYRFKSTTENPTIKHVGPLQKKGPRRIQRLAYQCVFIGEIWRNPQFQAIRQELESALELALTNQKVSSVFCQYFDGQPVSIRALPSMQHDAGGWLSSFSGREAEAELRALHAAGELFPAAPDGGQQEEVATLFVLPPGTILYGSEDRENNLDDGLHAYHSWYPLGENQPTAYYIVAAWGDGSFGIGKPHWKPWENTCAMIYHEVAELMTNPDVDTTDPAKMGWFTPSPDGDEEDQEIADMAILYYDQDPLDAFQMVKVGNGKQVPIQLLWSNADKKPWDPDRASGPHSGCKPVKAGGGQPPRQAP